MAFVDLRRQSGLPIKLDLASDKLAFGKGMKKTAPDVRTRRQMLPVLKNPASQAPEEFYYMYRGVCLEKDRKKIAKAGLRYDITVMPPFLVGDEYNKTLGHFHPLVRGTKTNYPEVYEVLHGNAHFLLQKESEFVVFCARQGDKCIMLPGFGHVTVNPSSTGETLVMANWVCPDFKSEYYEFEVHGGSQWFDTAKGFVENRKYGISQSIRLVSPKKFPELGLTTRPMYREGVASPKRFEWLCKPQNYTHQFEEYRKQ